MASFTITLGRGLDLRVTVPPEAEVQIQGEFMTALRGTVERIAHRYAPNHRGFLAELRDSVVAGIEPNRLGRGGIESFVDRVAYRIWVERQATEAGRAGTLPPSRVTVPPMTGELPTQQMRRAERDVC